MIGDKILFKNIHLKKCNKILPLIIEKFKWRKMTVTVGGEAGVGKTEVALLLQENLYKYNIRTKVVHIDDYYFTNWRDRNVTRKLKGVSSVGVTEIDWKKLKSITKSFKGKRKTINVQRIHKYTDSYEYVTVDNLCVDILIVEGLYANWLDADYKVYLEGTYRDTLKFREERGKETIDGFRRKVLRREHKEVLRTRRNIDLYL